MDSQPKDYLCLQAWMHLRYGRVTEAVVILEGLTVLIPGDAWVHRTLGYAYLQVGSFKVASINSIDYSRRERQLIACCEFEHSGGLGGEMRREEW